MVTLYRLVPMLAILAVPALVAAADDADSKARAALALAVAKQADPPAVTERPGRTPEQAAKAALAEALGKECDCGLCPASKPMPPASPPPQGGKEAAKRTVEKLDYAGLTAAVGKLAAGESLKVYVGQKPVESATGRLVELTGTIPGEKQIVGVWRCWREKDGAAKMQSVHPDDKPTRVVIGGRYYDRHADGSLFWCVECNGG